MGIGPMHLFVLVVIALLFFGPSKLPALGKSMGEAIKGFKDAMNDANDEGEKNARSTLVESKPAPEIPRREPGHDGETIVTEVVPTTSPIEKPKTPVS